MIKYNPNNERVKREYYEYQKEANRKSTSTIDNIRKAIDRYEQFMDFADFKGFKKQKAVAFKKHMAQWLWYLLIPIFLPFLIHSSFNNI